MATPFSRLGAAKRAKGVSAERMPPGQYLPRGWPALHYGPVPRFKEQEWDFRVFGATASGAPTCWSWAEFAGLPRSELTADFHCVTRFTVLDNVWRGLACTTLLSLVPPSPSASHVMVWAEYGYSTNMPMAHFRAGILATHRNGVRLSPEHGYPLRLVVPHLYAWKGPKWARGVEYLTEDRRGFWEERGYHNRADPWQEERYSYQER